jgi:hypothetical protein
LEPGVDGVADTSEFVHSIQTSGMSRAIAANVAAGPSRYRRKRRQFRYLPPLREFRKTTDSRADRLRRT